MRLKALLLATSLLLASLAMAQAKSQKSTGMPDRAYMQKIMDAWVTLDPANVAKYYDQSPNDVFFDIAPVKYDGWSQYAAGIKPFFATLKSAKATVNDDARVHPAGNYAWGASTVNFSITDKAGKTENLVCRWTAVWEKKGGNWVIVHDHFSAPMEPPK